MGKKSKILYYTILLVNVLCFILDLLPINFPFFRISFALSLVLIGLLLIIRAVYYKIDSSLFCGMLLFGCGVINFVLYFGETYFNLNPNQLWPYYFFAVALASLITALYFKDKLQIKLFILFLGFGAICLLFVQNLITLLWFIISMVAWFILYFIVNIILFKRRKWWKKETLNCKIKLMS